MTSFLNLGDWADDIGGQINLIDRLGKFWILKSFDLERFEIPRADKGAEHTLNEIRIQLAASGIDSAAGEFNRNYLTLYVRKTQARWARYHLREHTSVNSPTGRDYRIRRPRTRWKDRRRRR